MRENYFSVALLLLVLAGCSGASAPKIPTQTSAIDEFTTLKINGSDQQIWIRGNKPAAPLLLFLHGGPGHPHMHQAGAETDLLVDDYIVIQWDQRGAGASYSQDIDPAALTIQQMQIDTVAVIKSLLEKFNRKKLYLLGHSWGSYLGLSVAQKNPDLIEAFIAVGLVTDMIPGYKLMQKKIINHSIKMIRDAELAQDFEKKEKIIELKKKLEHFDIDSTVKNKDWDGFLANYFQPRTSLGFPYALKDIEGSNPHIVSAEEIKAYTEKVDKSVKLAVGLFFEILKQEPTKTIREIRVPILTILGRHDYNVEPTSAQRYMKNLKAPCKKTIWFEKSAHMMTFEEPENFKKVMLEDVLNLKFCRSKKML